MKKIVTALATAGLLAGVFGFAAPKAAKASYYDSVIWVSMKGTPVVDGRTSSFYASTHWDAGNYSRSGYDCNHPDYNDIQLAVDNSNDNDTIYICAGFWNMHESWQSGGPNVKGWWPGYNETAVVTDNPVTGDDTTGLNFVGAGAKKTIIEGLTGGRKLDQAFDIYNGDGDGLDASFTALSIQDFKASAVYGDDINCDRVAFKNNGVHLWGDAEESEESGGAIGADGNLDTAACTFTNNQGDDGGAIYVGGDWTDHASVFTNNFGGDYGGAAYVVNAVDLNGTVFTRNATEEDDGGALYVETYGVSYLDHVTAIGNRAGGKGGALYFYDEEDWNVYITSSVFKNNVAADDGGAIHSNIDDVTYITGSLFQANRAGDDGGAIYAYEISYTGNRFIGNVSGGCGGAVYAATDIYNPDANVYRGNRDSNGVSTYCY
jgi:predicted outer membrane repeat protein